MLNKLQYENLIYTDSYHQMVNTIEWVSDRQSKKSKMRPGSDEKFHGIKESSTPSSIFNLFLCPRSLNHSRPLPKWQERRCWLIGQKTKHLFLPLATIFKRLIIKVNEFNWTHLDLILTLNFHSNLIWALFFKYFFKPLNVRYVILRLYGGHLLLLWHSLGTEIDQLHAMLSFIDSPHDDPCHGHWSPSFFLLPWFSISTSRKQRNIAYSDVLLQLKWLPHLICYH